MRNIHRLLFSIAFITISLAVPAVASDLEKEKRWAAQIEDSLMTGESVELRAGDTPFLGLFTEASHGSGSRAALVVHGMGAHPDWPDVIYPLRSELPEYGWATLSQSVTSSRFHGRLSNNVLNCLFISFCCFGLFGKRNASGFGHGIETVHDSETDIVEQLAVAADVFGDRVFSMHFNTGFANHQKGSLR